MNKYNQELLDIMDMLINNVNMQQELLTEEEKELIAIVSLVTQESEVLLKNVILSNNVLSIIQIREAVFQCAPYIGYPKVINALSAINEVTTQSGIDMGIDHSAVLSSENRFESGLDVQVKIFGERMRELAALGENIPRESKLLIENCFGDFYTRDGLDLQTREMLTLAILINLGTEPQIKAHIMGNLNMGRSPEYITEIIFGCLAYCGYPRLLNALNYLKEVLEQTK